MLRRSLAVAVAVLVGLMLAVVVRVGRDGDIDQLTPFRVGAEADLDVAYADASPRNRLDVYVPPAVDGLLPAIVYLHPGGWVAGDKSMSSPVWDWTQRGYAVVTVNYRYAVAPGTIADAVVDVEAALTHLIDNADRWGIDPTRIGVYGFSAGGHLAAMVAFSDVPVAAVAVVGAPIDIVGLLDPDVPFFDGREGPDVAASMRERLGCAPTDPCLVEAAAVSPLEQRGQVPAPILVVHGADDDIVAPDHARAMAAHLQEIDADVELVVAPDRGHEPLVDVGVIPFFDAVLQPG